MNIKLNYFYLTLISLFFLGCKKDKEVPVKIDKTLSNYIDGNVVFLNDTLAPDDFLIVLNRFNFPLQRLENVRQGNILSRKNYFLEFACDKTELLSIFLEDIFVTPGDTVTINVTFDKKKPKIEKFLATGKNAGNYNYYFSVKSLPFDEPLFKNFSNDFNSYKKALINYRQERLRHFNRYIKSNQVSSEFVKYVKKDIDFQYWALLSNLTYDNSFIAKKAIETGYFSGFKNAVLAEDDNNLKNKYYGLMLINYLRLDNLELNLKRLTPEYFIKSCFTIDKKFKGKSREFLFLTLAQDYSENKSNKKYSTEIVSKFKAIQKLVISEDFAEAINRCDIDGKLNYKLNDNSTKEVKFGNLKGETLTFSDLIKRKRYLYLDFWASWCKPCINEFKSIEKTNTFLKSKNIDYILVDAHEGVFEKWLRDNKKLKLTNYESIYVQDLTSFTVLSKMFNLDVIPRFIFINPNGEVVTFDAPRPSDSIFQNKINDLIK
jgi:thiol-disulfide isomerase/thioredoxin